MSCLLLLWLLSLQRMQLRRQYVRMPASVHMQLHAHPKIANSICESTRKLAKVRVVIQSAPEIVPSDRGCDHSWLWLLL